MSATPDGGKDHLVASGVERDGPRRPRQSPPQFLLHLAEGDFTDPLGSHAGPRRTDTVTRAPDQVDGAGWLRVRHAHPARASEIQRRHPVLRKPRQHHVVRRRPPECGRQSREHAAQDRQVRLDGRTPVGQRCRAPARTSGAHPVDQCERIFGWRRSACIRQRGRHHLLHIDHTTATRHADRRRRTR